MIWRVTRFVSLILTRFFSDFGDNWEMLWSGVEVAEKWQILFLSLSVTLLGAKFHMRTDTIPAPHISVILLLCYVKKCFVRLGLAPRVCCILGYFSFQMSTLVANFPPVWIHISSVCVWSRVCTSPSLPWARHHRFHLKVYQHRTHTLGSDVINCKKQITDLCS